MSAEVSWTARVSRSPIALTILRFSRRISSSTRNMVGKSSVVDRFFFFSSRRRHTRLQGDWSSDVCSSDLDDIRDVPRFPTGSVDFGRAITFKKTLLDKAFENFTRSAGGALQNAFDVFCHDADRKSVV